MITSNGVCDPNFKSVAEIVFEIWTMKYFGSHVGIEDSAPWGPKFINFKSLAQIVFEIWTMNYFGGHLGSAEHHWQVINQIL